MMKRLLVLFLAVFTVSTFTLTAQTTVSGVITDAELGDPLIGANVIIVGTTVGASTDFDGNFSITSETPLPWNLEITYTGFAEQKITVTEAQNGLAIALEPSALIGQEVVVSASRRREKVQEAPASISVLSAEKLEASANTTDATRNLINLPGVQIQQQSANRINISMRGGAGLFGTSVFPIIDYRSLVGPGIGTFQSDQAGISQLDLQRVEVVRGPGSALYGPGVTQGVVHFITKSPIDAPGNAIEVIAGELNTFGGTVRHATKVSDKFGFKINASYKRGDEFTLDPNDPDDARQIALFQRQVVKPAVTNGFIDVTGEPTVLLTEEDLDPDRDGNMMQDDWFNFSANTTLEFRPQDDLSINLSGGYNEASSIFYNEQGEGLAQAKEFWTQARVQKGGLFAQLFYVDNDGGDESNPTFLYQTGNKTSIARTQLEAQVQYNFDTPSFLDANWTAGFDYRFAGQDTDNLTYGRNEDDDDFSVFGLYLQGSLKLAEKLDLVVAGRYDRFNFIDDGAFAPRAAVVFKADPKHTFRASYNRSNTTVSNLQLNIDFPLSVIIPGSFDVWLYGNKTPQTFDGQQLQWFNGLLPNIPVSEDGVPLLDGLPIGVGYGLVAQDVIAGLAAAFGQNPDIAPLVPAITAGLGAIDPATLGVTGDLSPGFNIFDGSPLGLIDAPISVISTVDNYEVGYKGLIGDKLGALLDVYYVVEKNNSQFTAISPAYRFSGLGDLPADLGAAVGAAGQTTVVSSLIGAGLDQATAEGVYASILPFIVGGFQAGGDAAINTPSPAFGGATLQQVFDALPFHATVPTNQVPQTGGTHLAAGYRTFDERDYWGLDLGLEYYFSSDFTTYFNYSWVSETQFLQNVVGVPGDPLPSSLNIPDNKFRVGLNYTPATGFRGSLAFQHDPSYAARAGQFSTFDANGVNFGTEERNLVDASIGYKFDSGLAIDISAQNLLDNEYRYLPNMPRIGRRTLAKLTYAFGADKE
ncbi:MAG: TonB-dependent receptor [Bacteroidota bacterium]